MEPDESVPPVAMVILKTRQVCGENKQESQKRSSKARWFIISLSEEPDWNPFIVRVIISIFDRGDRLTYVER